MTTKIQKWGNSLAVRIPKIIAESLGWRKGTKVYFEQLRDVLAIKSDNLKCIFIQKMK